MTTELERIAQLFSILHDGVITHACFDDEALVLQVRISYLARRIAPQHTTLTVRLRGADDLAFHTWPKDPASEPRILRQLSDIFSPPLDILGGDVSDLRLQVTCNQAAPEALHCGGTLSLRVRSALVLDEGDRAWSISELDAVAEDYWKEWSQRWAGR